MIEWFTAARLYSIGAALLRILLILLVTYVVVKLVRRASSRLNRLMMMRMGGRSEQSDSELERRANTLSGIIVTTAVVVIWVFGSMMMLREAGFDIGPLLAGAGVLGLAVGFGAQNLVRDVITGALMLMENQVRVGDVAEINGKSGVVEHINLRTTALRSLDGTLHIFPNGVINSVSNMTHEFSYYVFDVGVAYKEDTDRVVEVLREIAQGLQDDSEYQSFILEPLDVLGVDSFDDSAVVIKARFKTLPLKQWAVGREMNRRIKKRFDAEGIEIPFPHQSIYFGEASQPIQLGFDEASAKRLASALGRRAQDGAPVKDAAPEPSTN